MGSTRSGVLEELARRIREIETGARSHGRARVSTGVAALDELLPERGLRRGTLVELLSAADGAGAWTLGVVIARHVCGERRALVVLDAERQFYPPAAARLGLDLDRTIVVRPESGRDAYRAVVESLRCAAVGAVLGWHPRLSMLDSRRLQLAAESGGSVGILLRPAGALRAPSCAAVRLLVGPVGVEDRESRVESQKTEVRREIRRETKDERRKQEDGQAPKDFRANAVSDLSSSVFRLSSFAPSQLCSSPSGSRLSALDPRLACRGVHVAVVRCRGGRCGQSLMLEIDDETGDVHLPARLASGAAVARSARASG